MGHPPRLSRIAVIFLAFAFAVPSALARPAGAAPDEEYDADLPSARVARVSSKLPEIPHRIFVICSKSVARGSVDARQQWPVHCRCRLTARCWRGMIAASR